MNQKVLASKSSKPFYKTPVFLGGLICFVLYFFIVTLGFMQLLSEATMEWIDIALLFVGLIAYIGDTSGFYEKHPKYLPAARTITLGTISLSLSIHLFTQKNVFEHFWGFVGLAIVLLVIGLTALIYKGIKYLLHKR